jgi:hypothetical protein
MPVVWKKNKAKPQKWSKEQEKFCWDKGKLKDLMVFFKYLKSYVMD